MFKLYTFMKNKIKGLAWRNGKKSFQMYAKNVIKLG